jgi:ketopantoate reductase
MSTTTNKPTHILIGKRFSSPQRSSRSSRSSAELQGVALSNSRSLTVGTGAVGAFYGSRLALAPNTLVSVTCRSNYSAILASGLQLDSHSFGSYHFAPHAVYPSIDAAAQAPQPFDYVVVATKALPDVTDDSEMIAPVVQGSEETAIVLIQNGVGVEQPHRQRFPENPVLSAVTVISAQQTSPGTVKQNRWTRISVGPFLQGGTGEVKGESGELKERSERANKRFVELLKAGGIADAEEYDEKGLQLVRWHKLAVSSRFSFPLLLELTPSSLTDQLLHEPLLGPLRLNRQLSHVPRPRTPPSPRRLHERNLHYRPQSARPSLARETRQSRRFSRARNGTRKDCPVCWSIGRRGDRWSWR